MELLDDILATCTTPLARKINLKGFIKEREEENDIAQPPVFDLSLIKAQYELAKTYTQEFVKSMGKPEAEPNYARAAILHHACAKALARVNFLCDNFTVYERPDDSLDATQKASFSALRKDLYNGILEINTDLIGRVDQYFQGHWDLDLPYTQDKHSFYLASDGRGQLIETLPVK